MQLETPQPLSTRVREIEKSARKRALWTPGPSTREVRIERERGVEHLLPHRDPFLFVDRITAVDLEQQAIACERTIAEHDPVFVGHFPGEPMYPGVLQLETMGQASICLLAFLARGSVEVPAAPSPLHVRALRIHGALFLAPVLPGESLEILGTLLSRDDYTAVCAGQLRKKGGEIAAFAVMEVYLVE